MSRTHRQAHFFDLRSRQIGSNNGPSCPSSEMADTAMSPPRGPRAQYLTGTQISAGRQTPSAPPLSMLLPSQPVGDATADGLRESMAAVHVAQTRQRPNRTNKAFTRQAVVARPRRMALPVQSRPQGGSPERLLQPRRVSDELQRYLLEEASVHDVAEQQEQRQPSRMPSNKLDEGHMPSPRRQGLGVHGSSRRNGQEVRAEQPGNGAALSQTDPSLTEPSLRPGINFSQVHSQDSGPLPLNNNDNNNLQGDRSASPTEQLDEPLSLTFNHFLANGDGSEDEVNILDNQGQNGSRSTEQQEIPSVLTQSSAAPTGDDGGLVGMSNMPSSGEQNPEQCELGTFHQAAGGKNCQGVQQPSTGEGASCAPPNTVDPVEFLQRQMENKCGQPLDANMLHELQSRIDAMRESGDPQWEAVSSFAQAFFSQVEGALDSARMESERLRQEWDNEVLCQICFERRRDVVILPCMHFHFCRVCLFESFKTTDPKKCPLCRENVTGELNMNFQEGPGNVPARRD